MVGRMSGDLDAPWDIDRVSRRRREGLAAAVALLVAAVVCVVPGLLSPDSADALTTPDCVSFSGDGGTPYMATADCVVPADVATMTIFMVGGGGGGGAGGSGTAGGGGGAGQVNVCENVSVTVGATLAVVVGGGGASGAAGGNSSVSTGGGDLCKSLGGQAGSSSGAGGTSGSGQAGGASLSSAAGGGGGGDFGPGGAGGADGGVGGEGNADAGFAGGGGGGAAGGGQNGTGQQGGGDGSNGTTCAGSGNAPGSGGGGGSGSGLCSAGGAGGNGIIFLYFSAAVPCVDGGTGYTFDLMSASGGSYQCKVPDDVATVDILVVGAGGGGGYSILGDGDLPTGGVGGGGGGGEVKVCTEVVVAPGDILNIEAGQGGGGGAPAPYGTTGFDPTPAGAGGLSEVLIGESDLCTALGGSPGGDGTGIGGVSGNSKAGGTAASDVNGAQGGGGGGGAKNAGSNGTDTEGNYCGGAGGDGQQVNALASPGLFDDVTTVYGGGGGGGSNGECNGGLGGAGGGDGLPTVGDGDELADLPGGGGGGGSWSGCSVNDGGCGSAGGGTGGYVELRFTYSTGGTPVAVTPVATQSIAYGAAPDLSFTDDLPVGETWGLTPPTCAVYSSSTTFDNTTLVSTRPVPVGSYTIACGGGTPPTGYVADYTATGTLTVTKAKAPLNYTGTSGVAPGNTITLSSSVSPATCTGTVTYTVNGSAPQGTYADGVYEIEASYPGDANCEAAQVYAIVLIGGASSASNGGGQYSVSSAGKINFGYTVQISKSKTGATQVSGQILWNSQNGKFRFKGVISGFVKTTDCPLSAVCGRVVGTGTLRVRDNSGAWVVVGNNLSYKGAVIDAGTSSVCTGGKKSVCTTTNKPDFYGIDVLGASVTGEQVAPAGGWPTPVQLSGGNIVIKATAV